MQSGAPMPASRRQADRRASLSRFQLLGNCGRGDVFRHAWIVARRFANRAAALRQYDHCKELLRSELDVEPMLETRALYAQILNEDMSVVPPIGDRQATMSSGETRPATRRPGSSLAHLGEAMADMKAAHDRMAEAIREFDDLNVDLRATTDQTAKNAH